MVCSATEELHFDHIDPDSKSFEIGTSDSVSEERFWREILKCQLLCKLHHTEKSGHEQSNRMVGERNGRSKLTEENVLLIRTLAAEGEPQSNIAKRFNVTRVCINNIVRRKSWDWL